MENGSWVSARACSRRCRLCCVDEEPVAGATCHRFLVYATWEARLALPPGVPASDYGVTSHQTPPTPWPAMSPGFLSLRKVYSGAPSYVSCCAPSARMATPNVPLRPIMEAGTCMPAATVV